MGSGDDAVNVSPGVVLRGNGTPPGERIGPEAELESLLFVLSRVLDLSLSLLLSRSWTCLLGDGGMEDMDMEACRERGVAPGRPVSGLMTSETTEERRSVKVPLEKDC